MIRVTHEKTSHYATGVFLITLGVLLLASRYGYSIPSPFLAALGGALVMLGLPQLRPKTDRFSRFGGLIIGLLGLLLFLNGIGQTRFSLGYIWFNAWPILLIAIGITLIGSHRRFTSTNYGQSHVTPDSHASSFGMGDLADRTLWSIFGDIELDLTRENIPEGITHINLHTIIGDSTVIVPQAIGIEVVTRNVIGETDLCGNHYEGLLQSATYRSEGYATQPRRVFIQINCVIGEISVQHIA